MDATERVALEVLASHVPGLRDLLVRTDSVCSLVAYRFSSEIPDDIREELRTVSYQARSLYESMRRDSSSSGKDA